MELSLIHIHDAMKPPAEASQNQKKAHVRPKRGKKNNRNNKDFVYYWYKQNGLNNAREQ